MTAMAADPGLVQRAQHGEQIGGRLLEIAARAEVQHHRGTGERLRPERQQSLVGCDRARVEADRAGWGIVARLLARAERRLDPCRAPGRGASGPISASIRLRTRPPGRSSRGAGPVRSTTVDSRPMGQGPPSRMTSTRCPERRCDVIRRGRADLARRIGARRCDRQDGRLEQAPGRADARARAGRPCPGRR